jgi:hypothetical protein
MILKLLKTCTLGRAGVLLNLSDTRSDELIRAGIAEEFSIQREHERKVVSPEIKEQAKKPDRPRKK